MSTPTPTAPTMWSRSAKTPSLTIKSASSPPAANGARRRPTAAAPLVPSPSDCSIECGSAVAPDGKTSCQSACTQYDPAYPGGLAGLGDGDGPDNGICFAVSTVWTILTSWG